MFNALHDVFLFFFHSTRDACVLRICTRVLFLYFPRDSLFFFVRFRFLFVPVLFHRSQSLSLGFVERGEQKAAYPRDLWDPRAGDSYKNNSENDAKYGLSRCSLTLTASSSRA